MEKRKKRLTLQDKAWLAIKKAVKEVVKNAKNKTPLAIWKDGKVKIIRFK